MKLSSVIQLDEFLSVYMREKTKCMQHCFRKQYVNYEARKFN